MQRLLPAIRCLLALVLALPVMLRSQSQPWKAVGPEGGPMLALAQHPANPSILLAVTQGDSDFSLFRSTDHGLSWSYWSSMAWFGGLLIFGPADESLVYSSTYWGGAPIDRSTDGGGTWIPVEFPTECYASEIAPDPTEPALLHAAGWIYNSSVSQERPAYFKGRVDSSSWSTQFLSPFSGRCSALEVESGNPRNIYAVGYIQSNGQQYYKLWRSSDGGGNFSETSLRCRGDHFAIDPKTSGRMFIVDDDYPYSTTYMSSDYGASWMQKSESVPGTSSLVVAGGIVYASTESGIYKSTDGLNYTLLPGTEHWKRARWADWFSCMQSLCVEDTNPQTLIVATTAGMFRTTDGGLGWASSNSGVQCGDITALRLAPDRSGVALAARAQDAVYKATAASAVPFLWERLPEFYFCDYVQDLAFLAADPNIMFAIEGGG